MSFLDTGLKIVRLLSALVWLAVGVVTLWGTWVTFRQLVPYLSTVTEAFEAGVGPRGSTSAPNSFSLTEIQKLLPSVPRGSPPRE